MGCPVLRELEAQRGAPSRAAMEDRNFAARVAPFGASSLEGLYVHYNLGIVYIGEIRWNDGLRYVI